MGTPQSLADINVSVPHSAGRSRPRTPIPTLACDSHIHINDPAFAYLPDAALHPPPALVADYRRLQHRLGTQRVVVVQPSSYGSDNRCTLNAVAQFGEHARAVVVIDPDISQAELERLNAAGACGIRLNFTRHPTTDLATVEPLAKRMADLGWHMQIHGNAQTLMDLSDVLARLPCPLVFDHMARIPGAAGSQHPAFAMMLRLLDTGRCWVKLSGAYYMDADAAAGLPAYTEAGRLARAYVQAAPERLVWGSNWPHPSSTAGERPLPDDALLLDLLCDWAGNTATREQILLHNPARLYGFSV